MAGLPIYTHAYPGYSSFRMIMQNVRSNIILFGLKHSGKSSVAKSLSPFTGHYPFDLDEQVALMIRKEQGLAASDGKPYGTVVREYFRACGQAAFQKLEYGAVEHIVSTQGDRKVIIATGGGTMENSEAMRLLTTIGTCIFIQVPEQILFNRIIKGGIPPFLDPEKPAESFHELYERRTTLMLSYTPHLVQVQDQSLETVVALVLKKIKEL